MELLDGAGELVATGLSVSNESFWAQYGLDIAQALYRYGPTIVVGIFGDDMKCFPRTGRLTPGTLYFNMLALLGTRLPRMMQLKCAEMLRDATGISPEDLTASTPIGTYIACAARGGSVTMLEPVHELLSPQNIEDVCSCVATNSAIVNAAILNGTPEIMAAVEDLVETAERFHPHSVILAARHSHDWLQRMALQGYYALGRGVEGHAEMKLRILHEAAQSGNMEVLEMYRLTSKDVNRPRYRKLTLLASAASGGRLDVMRWLIDKGAVDFECAMLMAAGRGYTGAVRLLLDAGYDVRSEPTIKHVHGLPNSRTHLKFVRPIMLAAEQGHVHIIRLFMERGCRLGPREQRRLRNAWVMIGSIYRDDVLRALRALRRVKVRGN